MVKYKMMTAAVVVTEMYGQRVASIEPLQDNTKRPMHKKLNIL